MTTSVNSGGRLDRLPINSFHYRIFWLVGAGSEISPRDYNEVKIELCFGKGEGRAANRFLYAVSEPDRAR